ncbi:hypothetical protein E4U19_000963 [Claviceps sp. Clav32 group G5]|nr:hypothetical protein E4U19_000963 [Claviceps sp. Clav32 group G5]
MADVEDGLSVAASENSDGMDMNEGIGMDVDFGAIEIFDSNLAPTSFSSGAPEAIMTEDAAADSSSKKAKRDKHNQSQTKDKSDKKGKKRQKSEEDAGPSPSVPEGEESTARRRRKSKKRSTTDTVVPDSHPSKEQAELVTDTPWGQLQQENAAALSQKANNKRRLSHSAEGRPRRKQRSGSSDRADSAGEGMHLGSQDAVATSFLHRNKDARRAVPESVIDEDNRPESDPQASPTVAHLRRHSQSRQARSRESSVSHQMDTDAVSGAAAGVEREAERIAREAWEEHRSEQTSRSESAHNDDDTEMPDKYPHSPLGKGAADVTAEAQPSRRRSTRKKAKPSFYEQPVPEVPDDDNDKEDVYAELPSPSAMSPKPRNRKKRATKKEARGRKPKKEKKLSQSMRGSSVDEEEGDAADAATERRNRLTGYTQGRFSDAELARISRAVETFRADNDLSKSEVNDLIHAPGGTTAGEFNAQLWNRIFAECPDRHRQKVINITRKKFHNFVARGTWTPEQDAELAALIQAHGTKWSKIGGKINRHPEDLRDRYRNYIVCGANQRKDAWDEGEEARLTQYIMESMQVIDELRVNEPTRAILQKSYEELIDWQDISERMDRTRSRLQCITKWKSLNFRTHGKDKLVSTQPDSQISFRLEKARRQVATMPAEERFRLVTAVQATAVGTDVKIPWHRLVDKPFRVQWHRYTQMLLWRRLKATVPNNAEVTVRDAAQYLVEQYNQTGVLPDVPDDQFDDADEMSFMQSIAPVTCVGRNLASSRNQRSTEFVTESDAEDEAAEQDGSVQEAGNDKEAQSVKLGDLHIDPALTASGAPAKKSTPAAKRSSKAPKSGKRSRKSVAEVDPIEDVEMQEPEQVVQEQEQEQEQVQGSDSEEIDEEPLRRQKTPKNTPGDGVQSVGEARDKDSSAEREVEVDDDENSDMDDMEDVPARIAVHA